MGRALNHLFSFTVLALVMCLGTAVAASEGTIYFEDDFSAGKDKAFFEGTLDKRVFKYIDGQYEIDTTRGDSYGQSVLLEDLDDYRVEVVGQLLSTGDPDGGGFGLSFNYNEREGGSDFLLLLVYDRGAYTVLRYLNGQTTVLLTPSKTRLFESGDPVRVMVDSKDGRFTCYINGAQVAELNDNLLTSGGFGIFTTAKSVARFDDFKVYTESNPSIEEVFTSSSDPMLELYTGTWGDGVYGYKDEIYTIDTSKSDYIGLSPFPNQLKNFEFSVNTELISGTPTGGYGIYIRDYEDPSGGFNQFRFLVSEDWYAVEQSVGDMPMALAQWAQHASVKKSEKNRLLVRAEDKKLSFYVNGVEVYQHADEQPHTGAFGFFVSGGIKVAFDDVTVREL